MSFSRTEIADAAMVGRKKVDKDIERGRLEVDSLVSVACYVVMGRMGAGGLTAVTGKSSEPELQGIYAGEWIGEVTAEISDSLWSGTEIQVMQEMRKQGKTSKQAERAIRQMRESACVERLGAEDLEELGI